MASLKTNYKNDILDTSENTNRIFDLVDQNGQVVLANLSLVDKTVYSQVGDNFGANDINSTNTKVNSHETSISQINSNLTANAKKFNFTYDSTKQKYGYTIDNEFHPFSKGAVLIGTYSSDATIDVSAYGLTSASQFLAVCDTDTNTSAEWGNGQEGNFGMGWLHAQAKYIAPTKSLSGSTLSLTVGKMTYSSQAPSGSGTATKKLPTTLYYVGDIS